MPKVLQVIESEITRGSGKSEDDRCRIVRQYHSLDGEFLSEVDPGDGAIRLTLRDIFRFAYRAEQIKVVAGVFSSAGFTWPLHWTPDLCAPSRVELDVLAALKALVHDVDRAEKVHDLGIEPDGETMQAARAAIAKADSRT